MIKENVIWKKSRKILFLQDLLELLIHYAIFPEIIYHGSCCFWRASNMPQNWCLAMCCLGNTDVRNAGEISGKWNRYLLMNSKSSKHRKKCTLFFLLLNWSSILDFYSTWMKRLVFSQFQVNTISGYIAIFIWDFPPPLPYQSGIEELVRLLQILALRPDIWFSSGNCLHCYQLWFTQSHLVLSCCYSSLQSLPLNLAPQPHHHTSNH